MRKLIALVVVLFVAVAVLAAIAANNLNAYLNDNKAWIAGQIEASLGRPVEFDAVGLSLRRGLAVEIRGFRVAEDERFGDGDFLTVGNTSVRVALWPALFGRVEVSKVSVRDVSLTLIQSEAGLSIDSLGVSSERAPDEQAREPRETESSAPAAGVDAISIAVAEIRSGRIRYVDRTGDTDREVVIDQLEFWTTDLALDRPIEFQFVAEVLGAGDANLRIQGRVGPLSLADSETRDQTPIDVSFSLDPVEASALGTLPGLADAIDSERPLSGTLKLSGSIAGTLESPSLKFEFDATDAELPYGEDSQKESGTPLRLVADLAWVGQDLEIKAIDVVFEGIELRLSGSIQNLEDPTADLTIAVFGGTIEIDGGWSRNGRLELDTVVTDLELGELTRSLTQADTQILDGRLSMHLAVTGTGETWSEIEPGLEGLGSAQIDSGILHDINLIEEAVAGLTGVPGLSDGLPEKLRKKYPKLFSTGDTEFERLDAKIEVRDGRVQILGIRLDAEDFELRGWGSLSLAGDLDLSTRLTFSTSLSRDLIDLAKPLKYLRDDQGRVEIPIRVGGMLPDVSARPDADVIANKLGRGAAENLARKSFKKLKKKRKKKGTSAANIDTGRNLLESLLR